jgi:hypothetical protein
VDFSAYSEFPFPSSLPEEDRPLKRYFLSLSDSEQLRLLGACGCYQEFRGRVAEQYRSAQGKG